jgi:hypothetical protein
MRIHINLDEELVREIDEVAGKGNRSEYIASAAANAVKRDRRVRLINEGAGILSERDYPYWSTPEKVNEWLRDLRETPSIREDPIDRIPLGRERVDRVAERPTRPYRVSPRSRPD